MTTQTHTPHSTSDSLDPKTVETIAQRLDEIRHNVLESRGARDAQYIRNVIKTQRVLEATGRLVLLFSGRRPAWWAGTVALALAKILENMEIGHNVMHGQWDWMRDPGIHSATWEWDHASPSQQWKHAHNQQHHVYTNIRGRDNDLGFGIMRVHPAQTWRRFHLGQPIWNLINAFLFEYGIAVYDLELGKNLSSAQHRRDPAFRARVKAVLRKAGRQALRDYIVHPLLTGPNARFTLTANVAANIARNLWTHSVIMCGHFPTGVAVFAYHSIEGETRGQWYLRQIAGSANIRGGNLIHLMTGNLSFQIEHHLFPDLPSNRYKEIAPQVRQLCRQYGIAYVDGPLLRQVASAWAKVLSLSLPNKGPATADAMTTAVRARPAPTSRRPHATKTVPGRQQREPASRTQ